MGDPTLSFSKDKSVRIETSTWDSGKKNPSGQTVVRKRRHFKPFSANEFEKK
jgi:hypothetical protein